MILLDKGETIKKVIRQKPVGFIVEAVIMVLVGILPAVFYYFGYFHNTLVSAPAGALYVAMFFYSIWLLAVWVFLFIAWTDYYLETWLLTDARLITVTHVGIWSREVSALRFDKIKDVSVEDGKVKIILTNDDGKMYLEHVSQPEVIKELINLEQKKALMRLEHSVNILDTDQAL